LLSLPKFLLFASSCSDVSIWYIYVAGLICLKQYIKSASENIHMIEVVGLEENHPQNNKPHFFAVDTLLQSKYCSRIIFYRLTINFNSIIQKQCIKNTH